MTQKLMQCLIYYFEQSAPTLAIFPEKFISRIGRIKYHLSTGVSSKRQKTKEILILFLIKSIFYLNTHLFQQKTARFQTIYPGG